MRETQLESQLFCRVISEDLVDLAEWTSVQVANYLPKGKLPLDQRNPACSLIWCFLSRYGAFRTFTGSNEARDSTYSFLRLPFCCDASVKQ